MVIQVKTNGESKSIRQLLDSQKYYIDYYQREYKWSDENIIELITDLENAFLVNFKEEDERIDVKNYNHYFLGSIIINIKDKDKKFIVDGQQRLTTITLLLIYLNKMQGDLNRTKEDEIPLENLIYSLSYGRRSFNLDIEERKEIMDAIFNDKFIDVSDKQESIQNIKQRYETIIENFPESLKFQNSKYILPYFIDWFNESVDLVEISTYSEDNAYTIFETMNDRGLNLSPADMLKGYILTNIKDEEKRNKANSIWKKRINKLIEYDKKEETYFFKVWLRAKYAETIRERKKGSTNKDFENIGVQFNRWVRDRRELLHLKTTDDFFNFVKEFEFFSKIYLNSRKMSDRLNESFEELYYNSYCNFTLQPPLVLAPITESDDPETIKKKIKLVSSYIDTYIILRAINRKTLGSSAISYTMYNMIKKIRNKDLDELSEILKTELESMEEKFDGASELILHYQNKWFIKFLLARIASYIELNSDMKPNIEDYIKRNAKKPYEIEHIIPNKFYEYSDDFFDEKEFENERSKLGNLILLPKQFNQSFGDMKFEKKVDKYFGQNVLAKSLSEKFYENNPSFLRFMELKDLPFQPYQKFSKNEIKQRQKLYTQIISEIWNLNRFDV